jgi:hypothetical protein
VGRRKTRRPGEITIPPGPGFGKGCRCTCWPKPNDARPAPADLRPALAGVPRPRPAFYSHGDVQYLEHGTGRLAAELKRLWRAQGGR